MLTSFYRTTFFVILCILQTFENIFLRRACQRDIKSLNTYPYWFPISICILCNLFFMLQSQWFMSKASYNMSPSCFYLPLASYLRMKTWNPCHCLYRTLCEQLQLPQIPSVTSLISCSHWSLHLRSSHWPSCFSFVFTLSLMVETLAPGYLLYFLQVSAQICVCLHHKNLLYLK